MRKKRIPKLKQTVFKVDRKNRRIVQKKAPRKTNKKALPVIISRSQTMNKIPKNSQKQFPVVNFFHNKFKKNKPKRMKMKMKMQIKQKEFKEILAHLAKKMKAKQQQMWQEDNRVAREMRRKMAESLSISKIKFFKSEEKTFSPSKKKRRNLSKINLHDNIIFKNKKNSKKKQKKRKNKFFGQKLKSQSKLVKVCTEGYKKKYDVNQLRNRSKKFLTKKYLYKENGDSADEKNQSCIADGYISYYRNGNEFDDCGIDYYVQSREVSLENNHGEEV